MKTTPTHSSPRRVLGWLGWAAGVVVIVGVAALWSTRQHSHPATAPQSPVAKSATPASGSLLRSESLSLHRSGERPAPPRDDFAVLATASHDELVATAREMLAQGKPLEDIVALLEFLVRDRPQFAIDVARDIGRTDAERHVLLFAVVGDWAQSAPAAALDWAFHHAAAYSVPGSASLLYVVLEQVAADNPQTVVAVAEAALTDSDGSKSRDIPRLSIEALLKGGNTDLAARTIERWANGPEAGHLDATVYEIATLAFAQKSFSDATRWLESLPNSPGRNEALGPVAEAWSRQDPRAAMEWAQGLDPAWGGDDVRVEVFADWVKSDRPAAANWLQAHPKPDPGRLAALLPNG
jgi:hypothetical protein